MVWIDEPWKSWRLPGGNPPIPWPDQPTQFSARLDSALRSAVCTEQHETDYRRARCGSPHCWRDLIECPLSQILKLRQVGTTRAQELLLALRSIGVEPTWGRALRPLPEGSLQAPIQCLGCVDRDREIVVLKKEIARLREGKECHVARPGEGTYECSVDKPCPACRLRWAEGASRK